MSQVFFSAHCPTKGGLGVSLTDEVALGDVEAATVLAPVELHAARAKRAKASNERLMTALPPEGSG
jgi:hypothetical protein